MRLAETVEDLDAQRKKTALLETDLEEAQKQLKSARSDLTLVDKSQSNMLAELRKSVAQEQRGLEAEVVRLQDDLKQAHQTAAMQLSQINSLLLDKVDLQGQGLAARDALLQQEGSNSRLASSETTAVLSRLKEDLKAKDEQLDQTKEQLKKARNFIRQQDKLFKEQHQAQANVRLASRIVLTGPQLINWSPGCQRRPSARD